MSGDLDLDAVFGRSSPDDAFAAVLTEARMVLAEIGSPLEAELWGSDILAALGGMRSPAAQAIVPAAERSGSPEALAILRVLSALGWPELRAEAAEAASRLAGQGGAGPGLGGRPGHARGARVLALRGRPGAAGSGHAELRVPGRPARGLPAARSLVRRRHQERLGRRGRRRAGPHRGHGGRGSRHDVRDDQCRGRAPPGGTRHRGRASARASRTSSAAWPPPGPSCGPAWPCWPTSTRLSVKFESTALDSERQYVHTVLRRERCSPD